MLTAILPVLNKSDNYSRKPILFRPSNSVVPRYDLRVSVPPRHVRLLMGGEVFCRQDAPLL